MQRDLRQATPGDIPALAALEAACFAEPWNGATIEHEVTDPRVVVVLAEAESMVLAYGVAWTVTDEGEIARVATQPLQRGQGLGEQITRRLLELCAARGATQIFLEVRPGNLPARALYGKCGFVEVGRRKGYYADGEDALIMR